MYHHYHHQLMLNTSPIHQHSAATPAQLAGAPAPSVAVSAASSAPWTPRPQRRPKGTALAFAGEIAWVPWGFPSGTLLRSYWKMAMAITKNR